MRAFRVDGKVIGMRRRLFTILSLLSLVLCVCSTVAWTLSYSSFTQFHWINEDRVKEFEFMFSRGRVLVLWHRWDVNGGTHISMPPDLVLRGRNRAISTRATHENGTRKMAINSNGTALSITRQPERKDEPTMC